MVSIADLTSLGSNVLQISKRFEYSQNSDITNAYSVNNNIYLGYAFKNSNMLLVDNGPYAKSLLNYGGIYDVNSNMNSLFLASSNYATFAEDNWLLNSNMTISGWFKGSGFENGDEIMDFTYQKIEHPNVSPYTPAIQINKNEYYVAFTTVGTNSVYFIKDTKCDILVIGGGGGGGGDMGGGGGAGGVVYQKGVTLSSGTYTITVGAGGAARAASAVNTRNSVNGNNGSASSISIAGGSVLSLNSLTYQANGGGGGANYNVNVATTGNTGGSGGGGTNKNDDSTTTGGAATQGNTLYILNSATSLAGGYAGSDGQRGNGWLAGGGGGAGGTSGSVNGGAGVQIDITGQSLWYAAGGGGGVVGDSSTSSIGSTSAGKGGSGIGGNGNFVRFSDNFTNNYVQDSKHDGTNGTGSGGGGGAYNYASTLMLNNGGAGGSGIVIIRYTIDKSYDSSFFNNTSNLEAWYKFDDNSTNMLLDSSGKSRNLTNNGTTFDSNNCRTGNGSISFNGSSQYVEMHSAIHPYNIWNSGNGGISFSVWFKIPTTTATYSRIFSFGDGTIGSTSANSIFCAKNSTNNTLYFESRISGSTSSFVTTNTYIDNNWHHLVLSISTTGIWTTYIDNIFYSTSFTNKVIPSGVTWTKRYIARSEFDAALYTIGNIDDFRIYNKVLTADEVNIIYNIGYNIVLKRFNNNLSFELNNVSVYNIPYIDNTWNKFIWNIENVSSQGFIKINNGSKNLYNKVLPQSQLIRNYPVASLGSASGTGTDSSIVLSAQTHGNGLYRITASSSPGAMASYGAQMAFNKASPSGEAFWGSAATYSTSTTFYTGTVSTTYNNNLTYLGEWLQIQLPQHIVLTSYTLVGQVNTGIAGIASRGAKNFVILGSLNAIDWTLVDTETNITGWANLGAVRTFTINNVNQAYSYYRICINAIQGGDATYGNTVSIAEWELFGYIPNTYVYNNMLGSAVNKGSLYLSDIKILTNTYSDTTIDNTAYGIAPNSYHVNYQFKNQASLLTDDSIYNRALTNSGGIHTFNENRNSIYLTSNTEAFIPNQNWSSNVDLTLSCWFKTNLFQNGDKLIDFNTNSSYNIAIKNNNNKLSFQVNDVSVYDAPFVQNRWYYLAWNICNTSSSSGYVQLNDKKTNISNITLGFSPTLTKFPRYAMTSDTFTYPDASGIVVSTFASSVWSTISDRPWMSFNYVTGDRAWGTKDPRYSASGLALNTLLTGYAGDYLQIDLGERIILRSYIIYRRNEGWGDYRQPKTFRIYASNSASSWTNINDTNWVLLDDKVNVPYYSNYTGNVLSNYTAYRYYVLVVNMTYGATMVQIGEWELYAYPFVYSPYSYTNKLGTSTNKGNIYVSDFKVLTVPTTTAVQNSLYSNEIVLKNTNMTIHQNRIQYYNASSKINCYLHYAFQSPALLTIDSSLNNRLLNNNGGLYNVDSGKNNLLLKTGQDAILPGANWSIFSDLSICGWLKTNNLQNGDKLLEFSYNKEPDFVNNTTDMLAWYKFENVWNTSATSIATYNLTNDATNPVAFDANLKVRDTYSAYFDNTLDILSNSSINLNNTDYSIAFWVRLTGLTNNITQQWIVSQGTTGATRSTLLIGWNNNCWYFALWGDDCASSTMDYTTVNNTWVHMVFTFDYVSGGNNVFKIFMNGTLIGSKNTTSGTTNFATGTWRIGKSANGSYTGFTGNLDDFRMYNRVLTDSEISQLYTYTNVVQPLTSSPSVVPIQIGTENDYYVAFTATSAYTVTFSRETVCDILVVGGGGGGSGKLGGGGGAGAVVYIRNATLPSGSYNISIGDGGISYSTGGSENGQNTTITGNNISIIAQGGGGTLGGHNIANGKIGGSGGGAAAPSTVLNRGGATGTGSSLGGFSGTIYGNRGGNITTVRVGNPTAGTGGGGAGSTAIDINPSTQTGHGGNGILINITGNDYYWGGGGGGAGHVAVGGNGGIGGGGGGAGTGISVTSFAIGGGSALNSGENGQAVATGDGDAIGGKGGDNTGGGGGGGGWDAGIGGKGGSGIVIIRYSLAQNIVIKKVSNNLSFQINNMPIYSTPSFSNNTWTHILWNIISSSSNSFVRLSTTSQGIEQSYTKRLITSLMYTNKLGSITNIGSLNVSDFRIITEPLTTEIKNRLYLSEPVYSSFVDTGYVNNVFKNIDSLYYNSTKEVEANANGIIVYGNLTATNDIVTSYSDMRLKQIISSIDDPFDKIMQIQTFKYLPSELARSLNINDNKVRIGLSAQDVQKVLPEIVSLAPFDTSNLESGDVVSSSSSNYLSVSYERVVPLLVECLKELKRELTLYKQ